MPVKKLKSFLDHNEVIYETIKHSDAYTSQEIAAMAHIAGKEFAKTVMIKVHGKQFQCLVIRVSAGKMIFSRFNKQDLS